VSKDQFATVVHTPAKINVFFEVLGKRDDGYHEVETLMCPIGLYDTLIIQEEPSGRIELKCGRASRAWGPTAPWLDDVPEGPENLVVRAIELLRRRAGITSGAKVRLIKRIPTAAGLGGGSSDAAAALRGANHVWRLGWPNDALAKLSAELGSDIPFFLGRGPAICRGRGERVEPVSGIGTLDVVIVRPPEGLSTAAVYRACRPADSPQPLNPFLDALRRGDWRRMGRRITNRLEPAAEQLSPWIERLRHEFTALDCVAYGMSGSGTSYFGLCRHARHALRVARRLQANGAGSVFAVQSCH
jgi:4-diphosphocytidyl-2-C-methyl-D-erythritol kinase